MKSQKNIIVLGVIILLVFVHTVCAVDERAMATSWNNNQTYPAIDGKNVVWEDYYNGSNYDLYRFDLSTRREKSVYVGDFNQRYPDISGDIIVWQDDRNGNWDIYAYDMATTNSFAVCTASGDQQFPSVSGNLIVWQDGRNGSNDIYGFDLDTQMEIEICLDAGEQYTPDVCVSKGYLYERVVVWQDHRSGNADIYYYNVDTETEGVISDQGDQQTSPQIDMPRVVWTDNRNGNNDIYMFTFFSLPPATVIIENDPANQQFPVISGSKIVWQDFRNGTGDIYGGILGTLGTFSVCSDPAVQAYPAISGNFAVWHDHRSGDVSSGKGYDIYGGALGKDVWEECGDTLDFEFVLEYDTPDWTKITNHFDGVTFQSARPTCPSDTVTIRNIYPNTTSSGSFTIGNYGCEFIPGHLEMVFDNPQQMVSFYVGSYCGTYTVNAFDAEIGGNQLYSESFELSCDLIDHGVHRYVAVTYGEKNIRRIEIDNDWGIHVVIDDLTFNVDESPPEVQIDEPTFDQCTCDVFPIMGKVCDEDGGNVSYLLKYQPVGAGPDDWTVIGTYQWQLCDPGLLGEWDTSGLAHGRYYLVLEATNGCGLSASDSTVAFVDKTYSTVEIRYPNAYDGSNGVARGDSVCVDGTVWDHLCYDAVAGYQVDYAPAGSGLWNPIAPGPIGTASVINDPYARWDTTAIPDGDYDVRVTATDVCGNTKSDTVTTRVDNTVPLSEITSTTNCSFIPSGSGVIAVYGSAFDTNIYSWNLAYTGGTANNWTTISSGNSNVVNGLLGNWDTTGLKSCSYTLRLRVLDLALLNCTGENRNYSENMVSVKIGADLNNDGCVNLADLVLLANEWLLGCSP